MKTILKLGSVGKSARFNEDDSMFEFLERGLIVAEVEWEVLNRDQKIQIEELASAWRHDMISEEDLQTALDGIEGL